MTVLTRPDLGLLHDVIEPATMRVVGAAATLEPRTPAAAYLHETARRILASGTYRVTGYGSDDCGQLAGTLTYLKVLEESIEGFMDGSAPGVRLLRRAGPAAWEQLQAHDASSAAYALGVAEVVAPLLGGAAVLELGGGTGSCLLRLGDHVQGARRFVFSDIKPSFLRRARRIVPDPVLETAVVDINAPDPGLGPFDLVYAVNALHVADDVVRAVREVRRMLAPGGVLVLGEGSPYSTWTPCPLDVVLSLVDDWWDRPRTPIRPWPGFLMCEQWLAVLEMAGFSSVDVIEWSDDHRRFGGVYVARR